MGPQVLCFGPVVVCHGKRLVFQVGKIQSLDRYKSFSASVSQSGCSSQSLTMSSGGRRCLSRRGSLFCVSIKSQLKARDQRKVNYVENHRVRRMFSLRLRPRLRLFLIKSRRISMKLRNTSISEILKGLGASLLRNRRRVTISTFITIGLGLCYLILKLTAMASPKVVPYSDLITTLQSGQVMKVHFEEGSRRIFYNTNSQTSENSLENATDQIDAPLDNSSDAMMITSGKKANSLYGDILKGRALKAKSAKPEWQFSTRKIDHDENFLLNLMREKGTIYSSSPQSALMSLRNVMITVISLWIPLTPLMWLLYRQFSAANSPAKKRRPINQSVSFDDVEGVGAAKAELMEIVSCLQGSIDYKKLGAKLPKGVLLVGPPGTGKTLLARAVAGEAGVPFFTVSASEFVELFVGRGASRIRDLFNVARKYSPSIIFIDELDAVGGKRGRSFNDERDQTLNQLLTEMDGFESDMKVVVIAATNRPEALDPALCRPGRFSRKVYVGEPDLEGRRKILAVHLRNIPLEENQQLICDLVASLTPGYVGADLANIVNEAALLAARRGGETVSREDMMTALERAKFGIKGNQRSSEIIKEEIGRLFSWIPSKVRNNDAREGGFQDPMGYQTLS